MGLIYAVTRWLLQSDCNVMDSDTYRDPFRERFFMRVHFPGDVPLGRLRESFEPHARELQMRWELVRADARPRAPGHSPLSSEEFPDRLNDYTTSLFGLIHKWTEILQVAGKQMRGSASKSRLENRLIFAGETRKSLQSLAVRRHTQRRLDFIQCRNGPGIFPLQVSASLFQRVCAGEHFPVASHAQFDDQRGLSAGIVRRSKQDIGVKKYPVQVRPVTASMIR